MVASESVSSLEETGLASLFEVLASRASSRCSWSRVDAAARSSGVRALCLAISAVGCKAGGERLVELLVVLWGACGLT